ncbi:MAG: hypothetical protein PW788_07935 [Micavibrio sp.]|nr:hypothetical protein [Micavibrio sp.]
MNYIVTPEFHRNLWLKFSAFRLAIAPLFLILLTTITINLTRDVSGYLMLYSTVGIFAVVVILWGCYEASSAMQEELRTNTWDFQRMSSVTPGQLVFGKFFGCTSYVWYFGLLTMIVFVYIFGFYTPPLPPGSATPLTSPATAHDVFYAVLYMLLAGLIGQSLSFLVSFITMTAFTGRTGKYRQPRAGNAFIAGVVTAYLVFNNIAMEVARDLSQNFSMRSSFSGSIFERQPVYDWFTFHFSAEAFITGSLLFFLFWFMLGSYRIARSELMYGTTPAGWAAFMAAMLIYFGGLTHPDTARFNGEMFSLFTLMMFLTYAVMIFEASDSRKYARFFLYVKEGRWMRALENTHKWVVSVPFVLLVYALTLMPAQEHGRFLGFIEVGGLMLSMMFFALRDAFVVHAVFRTGEGRNAALKIISYYVLVYLLLPTLHFALTAVKVNTSVWFWMMTLMKFGSAPQQVPDVVKSAGFYFPMPFGDYTVSVIPSLLEAVLAGAMLVLLIKRQREKNQKG